MSCRVLWMPPACVLGAVGVQNVPESENPSLAGSGVFYPQFDAKKDLNQPRTEARTMIIGGVPVHDRDYKLPSQEMAFDQKTSRQADAY